MMHGSRLQPISLTILVRAMEHNHLDLGYFRPMAIIADVVLGLVSERH